MKFIAINHVYFLYLLLQTTFISIIFIYRIFVIIIIVFINYNN